ncbi:MAG: hypothetical protein LBC20_00440 [Planctomycetaceae bacterium]|jgi:hypothetical protein|nr:hypothetical protein [Planctomycetaceae bacterium]
MNFPISSNLPLSYQLKVLDGKQLESKEQHPNNPNNNIVETDRVSISPEAEEILAKIQAELAKTNDTNVSSDFSSQQNDFYNILGRLLDLKGTTPDKSSFLSRYF